MGVSDKDHLPTQATPMSFHVDVGTLDEFDGFGSNGYKIYNPFNQWKSLYNSREFEIE